MTRAHQPVRAIGALQVDAGLKQRRQRQRGTAMELDAINRVHLTGWIERRQRDPGFTCSRQHTKPIRHDEQGVGRNALTETEDVERPSLRRIEDQVVAIAKLVAIGVRSRATREHVIARAPDQHIVAILAEQGVIAGQAAQSIVTGAGVEQVCVITARDRIVAR